MMMDSFRKYTEELLDKGTACDIARSASDLQCRAAELIQFDVSEQVDAEELECSVKFSCQDSVSCDVGGVLENWILVRNLQVK